MVQGGGSPDRLLVRAARRRLGRGWIAVCRIVGGAVLAAMPAATGGVHGDVPEKIYTYSVNHPTHGDIGVFKNSILEYLL